MPYENEATPEGVCYVTTKYTITFEPTDIKVGGFPLNKLICHYSQERECGEVGLGLDNTTSFATVKLNETSYGGAYCKHTGSMFDIQCADMESSDFGKQITGSVLDILKRFKAQTPGNQHGILCGDDSMCTSNPLADTTIRITCHDTDGSCKPGSDECNGTWEGVPAVITPLGDGNTEILMESPALFPSNWCCYERDWEPDCDYMEELIKQLNFLQINATVSSIFKRLFSLGIDAAITGGFSVGPTDVIGIVGDITDPRIKDAAKKIQEAHEKAKQNYLACLINELNEANKC